MKNTVTKRGIKYVVHFTRLENLDSILTNGIIPRSILEQSALVVSYNDSYRLDGEKEASCFSVGHPNYKMFFSLRKQYPQQEWVVVACQARILWEKDCAFCCENAASNNVTAIPLQNRKGPDAFEVLFSPAFGKPLRDELKLPASCPTNPQAEILIFDTVEPKYIIGVVCQSGATRDTLKAKYPAFQIVHNPGFFSARSDYAHW